MSILYLSMRNFRLHEYFVSFTLYSSCAKSHTVGTAKPRCISRSQVRVTTGIGASSFPSPSLEMLRYIFFIPSMKKIRLKSFSIGLYFLALHVRHLSRLTGAAAPVH